MWPLINLAILAPLVLAAPSEKRAGPTVTLDHATVVGSALGGIDSFKGIPYAQPPTGQLRLKPPQPITKNLGTIFTTPVPRSCPQFFTQTNTSLLPENVLTELINTPLGQAITFAGEDCLTVNVQRPSSATSKSKLPVVFWIYGGGFEFGSTVIYDASELISTSVANGQDIMYVSVNYRLGGFGFLAGKEILKDESSNLGLLDQRLALQWVADNIEAFGGDPSKVTIWGESAGSISVLDQMVLNNGDNTYKGKPLFRAGLMDSGSIVPADPVDGVKGQQVYDHVVDRAGCSGSSDTLACLRSVSYQKFLDAAVSVPGIFSYNSVALSYLPRPDGVVLAKSPDILVQEGKMAKVPFIVGDQEDEGTLFSLSTSNVTTTEDLVNYLKTVFFLDATTEQVETLVSLYPTDPSTGSPYNTGILNQLYPQYKRIASLLGDIVFILTRRVFLQITTNVYPSVPSWSYLASYGYGTPILGTFHASDILPTYGIVPSYPSTIIQQYYINFFNNLDPNKGTTKGLIDWPQWNKGKQLLHFKALSNSLLKDDFRTPAYNYLAAAKNVFHI